MLTPDSFRTHSLDEHPFGDAIRRILASSIKAVDPGMLVKKAIQRDGNFLSINGNVYPLESDRVVVLAVGKAAEAMAMTTSALFDDLNPRGLIIPKIETKIKSNQLEVQPGGHPIPDEKSILAGEKAINLVNHLTEEDLLICLISGGGSALMTAPHPGISIKELERLNLILLSCGASITEINTVRRHLDRLKGGGLAKLATGSSVVSLILSDVFGNALEAIASGPTVPDPSTKEEALEILDKYKLLKKVPRSILKTLLHEPETPKQGDAIFDKVSNFIIGSNETAIEGAVDQARKEGYHCRSLGSSWQGEARSTARTLCEAFQAPGMDPPFCMVGGGETSVKVQGPGRGGRNQELALASVPEIANKKDILLISMATDGEEGFTDAAGAVVTSETLQRGNTIGMDAAMFLEENDSYTYFESLGDLIKTGPSGTNVNDLFFLFGH